LAIAARSARLATYKLSLASLTAQPTLSNASPTMKIVINVPNSESGKRADQCPH